MISLLFFAGISRAQDLCEKTAFAPLNIRGSLTFNPLPYSYFALEPRLWSQVVFLHSERHQRDLFNSLQSSSNTIEEQAQLPNSPQWSDAFEYYSHYLYWFAMAPENCTGDTPGGDLGNDIERQWGSFGAFRRVFEETANELYGSGWVYLCRDTDGLQIEAVEEGDGLNTCVPLLALDLWEHAYYLQYLSDRTEYIRNWWRLLDWNLLEYLYSQYISQGVFIPT